MKFDNFEEAIIALQCLAIDIKNGETSLKLKKALVAYFKNLAVRYPIIKD